MATPAPGKITPANPTLRRNFMWVLGGNGLYAACQWAMLVAIARLGDPRMVGEFTLALAITAPVVLFANLQLVSVQATDAREQHSFADFLALRLATTAVAMGVIAGIAIVSRLGPEVTGVVLIIGFSKAFDALSDVVYGMLQQRERMRWIAVGWAVNGLVSLLAMITALLATGSIVWGAVGYALGSAVALAAVNGPMALRALGPLAVRPRWRPAVLLGLARIALPLALSGVIVSLNVNIPRYVIGHSLGEAQLGVFGAFAYVATAGGMVLNALGQAAVPRLARAFQAGDLRSYAALTAKLALICGGLGLLLVVFAIVAGPWALQQIYGATYAARAEVFAWLMAAAALGFLGGVLGYAVNAARAFDRLTIPFLIIAGVTLASSLVLIPRFGLLGAAWAMGCTSLAGCLLLGRLYLNLLRARP